MPAAYRMPAGMQCIPGTLGSWEDVVVVAFSIAC